MYLEVVSTPSVIAYSRVDLCWRAGGEGPASIAPNAKLLGLAPHSLQNQGWVARLFFAHSSRVDASVPQHKKTLSSLLGRYHSEHLYRNRQERPHHEPDSYIMSLCPREKRGRENRRPTSMMFLLTMLTMM